jgi:hypothetical protein
MKRRWFLGHMLLVPVSGAVHAATDPPAGKGVFRTAGWDELIPKHHYRNDFSYHSSQTG